MWKLREMKYGNILLTVINTVISEYSVFEMFRSSAKIDVSFAPSGGFFDPLPTTVSLPKYRLVKRL